MARKLILLALIVMCGCGERSLYYRQEVSGGYTYWREYKPTTFHGLCANMYKTSFWVVEHPYGHHPNADGTVGSFGTEIKTFASKSDASAWAESVCPTGVHQ
jgi:hypothetical protein